MSLIVSFAGNLGISVGPYEQGIAPVRNDAVGCIFVQSAARKLAGGVFGRSGAQRHRDAVGREGDEPFGNNVHPSTRSED